MDFREIALPSNRKFGSFFSAVFAIACAYFFLKNNIAMACLFALLAAVFFLITIFKDDVLEPMNRLWMRLGLLLGMVVSPIVLGVVFFCLFTPVAFVMRLFGRDELKLCFISKASYWIKRDSVSQSNSFKNQF
ncbi:SxtJ family membrane protein [Planktomarina sp.]|nr:SxtJ family membrane protein [Planktomarina sp.]